MNSQTLQRSRYNYFVERSEGVVGYNARTGVFALLAPDIARNLRGNEPIEDIDNAHALVKMGFLHHGDELENILADFEKAKQASETLKFTILPTLLCNFACDYCFQGDHSGKPFMKPETQEATLRFIKTLVTSKRKGIICTWFGGEPLIAKDIVLRMSQQLREIAAENQVSLNMDIITNGVLLNSTTSRELAEVGIKQAQVTFDSLIFKHSKKRGVIDSEGNQSLLLRNIIAARDYLDISIRINVFGDNASEVPQIIEILSRYGFKDTYYLARIKGSEDGVSDKDEIKNVSCRETNCRLCEAKELTTSMCNTLSRPDYAEFERKFFLNRLEALPRIVKKLIPVKYPCSAITDTMFVIDPDGEVSPCWESAGLASEAIGNVHNMPDSIDRPDIAQRWQEYSPLAYGICKTCKVLPLCMGGCPHSRIFMESPKPSCDSIKQHIQSCVDMVGKAIDIAPDKQTMISIRH